MGLSILPVSAKALEKNRRKKDRKEERKKEREGERARDKMERKTMLHVPDIQLHKCLPDMMGLQMSSLKL